MGCCLARELIESLQYRSYSPSSNRPATGRVLQATSRAASLPKLSLELATWAPPIGTVSAGCVGHQHGLGDCNMQGRIALRSCCKAALARIALDAQRSLCLFFIPRIGTLFRIEEPIHGELSEGASVMDSQRITAPGGRVDLPGCVGSETTCVRGKLALERMPPIPSCPGDRRRGESCY
jgi:hypothetical protein